MPWGGGQPYPGPYGGPPPTGPYGAPPIPYGPSPYGPASNWQPAVAPALPAGVPPHDRPQRYPLLMRSRSWRWWRPVLGLLVFGVVYVLGNAALVLSTSATGALDAAELSNLVDPVVLLANNVLLIVAIPVVWLCWFGLHRMSIGWAASVAGRFRWRLLAPFAWRALVTLGLWIVAQFALELWLGPDTDGPVPQFGWLLVVVVLTTPLQSAAEEYVFRGYLTQAIAGWIRAPLAGAVIAALLTAGLFSLAHLPAGGIASLEFGDRFLFGLAASAVVWLTGGLEASVVLHAVNNVLVFVLAGLLGDSVDTGSGSTDGGMSWLAVLLDAVAMALYVLVVALSRRRLRIEVCSAAPEPAVPPVPALAGAQSVVLGYPDEVWRRPHDDPPSGGPPYGPPGIG